MKVSSLLWINIWNIFVVRAIVSAWIYTNNALVMWMLNFVLAQAVWKKNQMVRGTSDDQLAIREIRSWSTDLLKVEL